MNWESKKPSFGDHIRVNRGLYSHHGIYASDDCVIHFASLVPGHETDPEMASICISSLEQFSKGDVVEVACYNEEENKQKRAPQDIVNYAFTKLGEKGYNLISNNCEHFANECVFGKKISQQVSDVSSFISSLFR